MSVTNDATADNVLMAVAGAAALMILIAVSVLGPVWVGRRGAAVR